MTNLIKFPGFAKKQTAASMLLEMSQQAEAFPEKFDMVLVLTVTTEGNFYWQKVGEINKAQAVGIMAMAQADFMDL